MFLWPNLRCFRDSLLRSRRCAPAREPSSPREKVRPFTVSTVSIFFLPPQRRRTINSASLPDMRSLRRKAACLCFLLFFLLVPSASTGQFKRDKNIWNYDGGVIFATDGALPNGVGFRVSGDVNAADFFNNLKRVDDERGTVFRRGTELFHEFPETLDVSFSIRDEPSSPGLRETGSPTSLTR